MNSKISLVTISCLIGLFSASLYAMRIHQLRNEITDSTKKDPVLVSLRDIKSGECLRQEDLTTSFFTRKQVPKRSIGPEDIELILGRKVFHPVPAGEIILWTDFPEGPRLRKPSEKIPVGYRAISLPADETHTMVHFITPGDSVDIVSSSFVDGTGKIDTRLIAENITILSVGQKLEEWSQYDFEDNFPLSVTILATPNESLKIMKSAQTGEIYFLVRGSSLFSEISTDKSFSELKDNVSGY